MIVTARGQEYYFMQDFSSLSIRNPAFTGVMQIPALLGRFEWEGEPRHDFHITTYMLGYEQRLSEKAGAIGCRMVTNNRTASNWLKQNRQLHLQYANYARGQKGNFLFGFRAGFDNTVTHYKDNIRPDNKTVVRIYSSVGAALAYDHFYIGTGLINFGGASLSKTNYYRSIDHIFSLQSAGFFEINPDPRIFIVPSINIDVIGDEEARATLKLNVASPHISAGAGVFAGDDGPMVEVNFGYMAKKISIGYTLACGADPEGFSSDTVIFDLHLGYYFFTSQADTGDNRAYYFRHLF